MDLKTAIEPLVKFADPEEIRQFFVQNGITGMREGEYDCPIANFVKRQYPDAPGIPNVSDNVMIEPFMATTGCEEWEQVAFTPAMTSFVMNFDQGAYPELDAYADEDDDDEYEEGL